MSLSFARASEQTVLSLIVDAIVWIASKSPFELAAKPASITSTFIRSSCFAIRIFSSFVIDAPGDCSPSRNVVSKMISLSAISGLLGIRSIQIEKEYGCVRHRLATRTTTRQTGGENGQRDRRAEASERSSLPACRVRKGNLESAMPATIAIFNA